MIKRYKLTEWGGMVTFDLNGIKDVEHLDGEERG